MRLKLEEAVRLREAGRADEARAKLILLLEEYEACRTPYGITPVEGNPISGQPAWNRVTEEDYLYAELLYQIAWCHDVLGLERQAVPYYERGLSAGLAEHLRPGALLGLGSTYRTLGEYDKARSLFEQAMAEYPEHRELRVFYAMTLYNLGKHERAASILLHLLAGTSADPGIAEYAKAIAFYADNLDRKWE
ncbi:tetratricopeptide repeat protein [Paenibacillus sp. HN-1]|uniref:tetratricopeptide repeat protein n=1 Tax=Paenibacillus TaxID=44249 RepID=UPI001CA8F5C1|nr:MULTISPECIES: tetratricopeptide repeat protein [Paenibacillus]MBY9082501.1 tetratricopeptide repeat protein [Paenibacillus sp. CGMCC 1.18879]MBY9084860.1 tetratricopeptide repeat protein [Paenibacillus sinensis]